MPINTNEQKIGKKFRQTRQKREESPAIRTG
jgi:hypothetical protein